MQPFLADIFWPARNGISAGIYRSCVQFKVDAKHKQEMQVFRTSKPLRMLMSKTLKRLALVSSAIQHIFGKVYRKASLAKRTMKSMSTTVQKYTIFGDSI